MVDEPPKHSTTTVLRSTRKIKRDIFRTRSNCEAAMAGASKAERSFLRRSIAVLDALNAELDIAAGEPAQTG